MAEPSLLMPAEIMLRGAAASLLLMLAALLWRDHRGHAAGRLGAAFAFGVAAYALCAATGMHAALGLFAAPVMAVASANNFVFWLFARALFDDGFIQRRRHWAGWGVIAGLGLFLGSGAAGQLGLGRAVHAVLAAQALVFAVLALREGATSWQGDLVEPRRRLRVFVMLAGGGHMIATSLSAVLADGGLSPYGLAPSFPQAGALQGALLLAIAAMVSWSLSSVDRSDAIFAPAYANGTLPPPPAQAVHLPSDAASQMQIAHLEHTMATDKLYRFEGLTIAQLARHQGLPEHRLRFLINKGLGYRNFSSFVNSYRLAEVRAALCDAGQSGVPVLTIAMDAGFNSLGPFNRAFKAETGQTPTEFRQSAARKAAAALADFESQAGRGNRSGRISRSASD